MLCLAALLAVAVVGCSSSPVSNRPAVSVGAELVNAATLTSLSAAVLPASPVSGRIASHADEGMLYSIVLQVGEELDARISTTDPLAVGLLLYAPGTTSVEQHDNVVAGYESSDQYPSELVNEVGSKFVASVGGTYFLRVINLGGQGTYAIDWAKGSVPTVGIAVSNAYPAYGGSSSVSGIISGDGGARLAGERAQLWSVKYPYTAAMTNVAEVAADSNGVYSFTVKPSVRTRYQVLSVGTTAGYVAGRSAIQTVHPRVYLGTPRVSATRKYRNRTFSVWGYLRPKHTSGAKTIKIRCYHKEKQKNGSYKYVWRKTVYAKNYSYTAYTTRYKTALSLRYRGRWRLNAYMPDDGYHRGTTSSRRYITVR